MKSFINAIYEIRAYMNLLYAFRSLLDTLLVFLGVYFILVSLALDGIFAILPAMVYLGFDIYRHMHSSRILDVEKKYPELNMKLRTGAEYARIEGNPFVDDLHKELFSELKSVSLGSFINMRKTTLKVISIMALCFLIVFLTYYGIYFDAVGAIDKIPPSFKPTFALGSGGNAGLGSEFTLGEGDTRDIYGEASLAELGQEAVDLAIFGESMELNTRTLYDPTYREFEEARLFPEDIFTQETEVSNEGDISKEHMELVKNYFLKTAQAR